MATVTHETKTGSYRTGYPPPSVRFDWIVAILCLLMLGGLTLDVWAHNHGRVDQSFFTPWHGVMYSAYAITGGFLVLTLLRNVLTGYPFRYALPRGYLFSLLGVLVFAFGGIGDLLWHSAFGIEKGIEAGLSPTHLMLAAGFFLMFSGPLLAAWNCVPTGKKPGWPAILSLTMCLTLLAGFTEYAHPFLEIRSALAASKSNISMGLGVVSILFQTGLMMGGILFLVRRWPLPFGALTIVIVLSNLIITFFQDTYILIPGAIIVGVLADGMVLLLKPSTARAGWFYAFGFLVPMVFYTVYFLTVQLAFRVGWTIHLWMGSIWMAGIIGVLMAVLMVPPKPLET